MNLHIHLIRNSITTVAEGPKCSECLKGQTSALLRGRWTEQAPLGTAKHPTVPIDLTLIQGTRSLIAGGRIGIEGASPVQGVVLTYGP
jgi:hypothetical protein